MYLSHSLTNGTVHFINVLSTYCIKMEQTLNSSVQDGTVCRTGYKSMLLVLSEQQVCGESASG